MGASGWDYVVEYSGDLAASLRNLQEELLRTGKFLWMDDEQWGWDTDLSRPSTLEDLARAKEEEEFWELGTHSILDVDRISAADVSDEVGAVRPLTSEELARCFGTERPSVDEFHRVWDRGGGPVAQTAAMRWAGRCAVLYSDAQPTHAAFWGFSGD